MYKRRISGKVTYIGRAAWLAFKNGQQNQQQPGPQPTPGNNLSGSVGLDALRAMDENSKIQAIIDALNNPYPPNLPRTDYQKAAYYLGLDAPPQMVDSDQYEATPGEDIYRTVRSGTWNDTDDIVANVMLEENSYFSDTGGSMLGTGLYFTNSMGSSIRGYGSTQPSAVMRAKLAPGARKIEFSDALRKMQRDWGSNYNMMTLSSNAAVSLWAVSHGYDAVVESTSSGYTDNYHSVLHRDALIMDWTYHKLTPSEYRNPPSKWNQLSR